MDGAPVFGLVRRCLPGVRVRGFAGVLNATTTRILARMEQGASAAQALREARALGIVEADPRHDLEGWDAALKGCALARALMGARVRPSAVRRRGIGRLTTRRLRDALAAGRRYRLVVRAERAGRGGVRVSVGPERLPIDHVLASAGCDGVLLLETDLMGTLAVWEGPASPEQTAYGVLVDLIAVARTLPSRARGGRPGP
jgi:homoserine dehydrogenase